MSDKRRDNKCQQHAARKTHLLIFDEVNIERVKNYVFFPHILFLPLTGCDTKL